MDLHLCLNPEHVMRCFEHRKRLANWVHKNRYVTKTPSASLLSLNPIIMPAIRLETKQPKFSKINQDFESREFEKGKKVKERESLLLNACVDNSKQPINVLST